MTEENENNQEVEEVVDETTESQEETGTEDITVREIRNEEYVSPDEFPEDIYENVNKEETEEVVDEEVVDEEESQEEVVDDEVVEDETSVDEEATDDYDVDFYQNLSEETGLNIENPDVLKEALSDFKEYLDQKDSEGDAFADLPKELQMAIEVAKTGGDYQQSLKVLAMDFDNMSQKDLLKQKFYNDNESLVQKDKEFADMKFEKEYESKYGILNQEHEDEYQKEEFEENNKRDIEYAQKSLERDAADVKEELEAWRQENTTPDSPIDTVSETEQAELMENHHKAVTEVLDTFEGTLLAIDDNPDNDFLVGMTDETKGTLNEVLTDPRDFLSEVVGIDYSTGSIDYEKLALAANLLLNADTIGSTIRQYSIEKKNKETVEGLMTNARTKTTKDHVRQPVQDTGLAIGEAIRKKLYVNR
jgi:hypothetical protein